MPHNLLQSFSLRRLLSTWPLPSCFQHKNTATLTDDIDSSIAKLPELPPEVLSIIGSWCSTLQSERNTTLFNLCLVSRSFAAIFTPYLYRELRLRQLTKGSPQRLLHTLTNAPLLGTHIRTLDTTGNIPHVRKEVILEALIRLEGWIVAYYPSHIGFLVYRASFYSLQSPEMSLAALLLVLSPNLTALQYQSHRNGQAFFMLVNSLKMKQESPGRGDRHPLSLIEHLEISKHPTTNIIRGDLDRMTSNVITARLRVFSLDGIRLVSWNKGGPTFSMSTTVQNVSVVPMLLPPAMRLQVLKLWGATIDMDVLGEMIRNSPQLEDISILDPVLTTPILLSHAELLSEQHIMSLAALGNILRRNSQCHKSLRSLRIHYHAPYLATWGASAWQFPQEAIGSLAQLTGLEVLNIDTDLLMGPHESTSSFPAAGSRLQDYLPTSLQQLKCFPTSGAAAHRVVMQVFYLMEDTRFTNLNIISITMNMDESRAIRRQFTQHCRAIEIVPRGWVYVGAGGDIDDETVISTGTGHAAVWLLESYARERMRAWERRQLSKADLEEK